MNQAQKREMKETLAKVAADAIRSHFEHDKGAKPEGIHTVRVMAGDNYANIIMIPAHGFPTSFYFTVKETF